MGTGDFEEYVARRGGKEYAIHELRNSYLRDTEGLITYQEQFLLDCKTFAGWDLAYADAKVRKNKNIAGDADLATKFICDARIKGYRDDVIIGVWDEIVRAVAGGYSFNKSHSASYAVLSYVTAWLKCYYPAHFYAAMLTHDTKDTSEISALISEVKSLGVKIMPPDINLSTDKFVAKGDTIYYRLDAIKDVGTAAIKAIFKSRPIKSLESLIETTQRKDVKTNVLESLIKAGCFDFQDINRTKLINIMLEKINPKSVLCPDKWSDGVKQQYEFDSLGLYLSGHPLDKYHYKSFFSFAEDENAIISCSVAKISERPDKSGKNMAFLDLQTQYEGIRGLIFSSNWSQKVKDYISDSYFYQITGKKSGDSILIKTIKRLEM